MTCWNFLCLSCFLQQCVQAKYWYHVREGNTIIVHAHAVINNLDEKKIHQFHLELRVANIFTCKNSLGKFSLYFTKEIWKISKRTHIPQPHTTQEWYVSKQIKMEIELKFWNHSWIQWPKYFIQHFLTWIQLTC